MLTDFDRTKAGLYTVNTKTEGLNLRVYTGTDSTVLAEMPKGSKVVCYGIYSGDWLMVDFLRDTDNVLVSGFAHGDYLKKGESL